MHKNTYINSPKLLDNTYNLIKNKKVYFAGQITGVEGYVESISSGFLAGINAVNQIELKEKNIFSEKTMIGALAKYISTKHTLIHLKIIKKKIDIKEAIENRKGLYKRINLKEIMEKAGVESRINQFMLKRKINPVILEAINEDEKMTEEYIYSLIEKKNFLLNINMI